MNKWIPLLCTENEAGFAEKNNTVCNLWTKDCVRGFMMLVQVTLVTIFPKF